ncbi:MAG TPA: PQQ-binding-like beta-propeller repeat protein, partial [Micromonosporaceae bacterium]|nr:PQQ-binding-like beta-propeller repeat protein [Micromonosporaceae bacterium]
HYQCEQIQPPQVPPHHVDYYRRPGKPAWGHPELWNDDGTGGMLLPTLFQMAMRGTDGVGSSGDPAGNHGPSHGVAVPDPRSGDTGPRSGDPRSGGAGRASMLRAAYDALRRYGPVLAAAENADPVAIVVSTRMCRIEDWDGRIGSAYFDGLFEAYNACLYAHRPASFVFAEDVTAEALTRYRAVLVVGQRVELDPPLTDALRAAATAGVAVYADGTCRPELVAGYAPLGISFDRVRQDPSAWQDDAAYHRFRRYFLNHADALRKVFNDAVPPVADCDQPEVLLSERRAGDTRFIWAVNNTMLDIEPGLAWRMSLLLTQRIPVLAQLRLDVPAGHRVIDLFTGERVHDDAGTITADLRTVPARLYAIVPDGIPLPGPLRHGFGPHVRDVAVSGNTALLTCFNWDYNLYGVDLRNGHVRWRERIGHFFGYAPTVHTGGFAAQGFDLHSAEGHHLYLCDSAGTVHRRFSLFGLPKRATDWAVAEWLQDTGLPNFAVAPGGGWVASCGDLGLVVWDTSGNERWSDQWWSDRRQPMRLLALDDATLLTYHGRTVTGFAAADGAERWSLTVADTGTLQGGLVSGDRSTLVLWSDTLGGRVFVIRAGQVVRSFPTAAEEVAVSPDGQLVVVTAGRRLSAYHTETGEVWSYAGDDLVRRPRISLDGERIAAGTELGTLVVLGRDGTLFAEQDLGALPVPTWLPDGELLAATWTGTVTRYRANLTPRWRTTLTPAETDVRPEFPSDPVSRTRKSGWGNATGQPLPLTPNLLTETRALITVRAYGSGWQGQLPLRHSVELLRDGSPEPPPEPWLHWHDIGYVDSGWRDKLSLHVDTFRTQIRLTGVSLAEDPTHPESWLRDVHLQWWDAAAERWLDGPMLLSDSALHSHLFPEPLEAARFRFVTTPGGSWPAGNVRLGELVFHGETLGASHP